MKTSTLKTIGYTTACMAFTLFYQQCSPVNFDKRTTPAMASEFVNPPPPVVTDPGGNPLQCTPLASITDVSQIPTVACGGSDDKDDMDGRDNNDDNDGQQVMPVVNVSSMHLQNCASNNGSGSGMDSHHDGNHDGTCVQICHIPPGNPAQQHTLVVGLSALRAHSEHSDYIGECGVCPPAAGQ